MFGILLSIIIYREENVMIGVAQIGRVFMVHGGVVCPLQRGILKVRRVKENKKKKDVDTPTSCDERKESKKLS